MAEKWTTSTPFQGPGEEGAVGGALHVNNGLQAACTPSPTPLSRGFVCLRSRLAARLMSRFAASGNSHTNKGHEDGEGKKEGIWNRFSKAREDLTHRTHDIRTEGLRACGTARAAREGPHLGLVLEGGSHLQRQKKEP